MRNAPALRRSLGAAFVLACGLGAGGVAHAIEYRSVAAPAILYDAPSEKGKRLFIVSAGTPVEVVVTLDKWIKVREPAGSITWIERSALSTKRTVQISATRAVVRRQPTESSTAVFEAAKDVVLELSDPPAEGWAKVRHTDGASGYVRVNEVWGL
ncbi:SH3 domain-containing protein [Thauera sinica]|uniref:SH3 domain-containing protein n=1 Tax=Thauera sinica TaxID=2665146 RepID=A0ABW1ALU8_9RHOO